MEIILAQRPGILSSIIEMISKGKYSHVLLRYGGNYSQLLLHAYWYGVAPDLWSWFTRHYKKYIQYKCNFNVADKALENLTLNLEHQGYDFMSLIMAGLSILFKLNITSYKKNNTYNCVELFCEFIKECKKLDPSIDINTDKIVTPKDVLDLMNKSNNFNLEKATI